MNEESSTESTAPAHRLFSYRDIGEAIAPVAKKAKCSIVTTYCGHGIGSLFHTAPNVPHYPKNKAKGTMQPGHIFTIEPMINLGQHRDVLWPDDWTAVTADGSRSAQFEHTMLVTENGVELLTAKPGEPIDRIEWTREKFQR
jgi:methionyl aminopeptidase